MNLSNQIAKHLKDVFFGGNWTVSNLKEHLADVTWEQATTKIYSLNTIATLVFHINYYVTAVIPVFEGEALNASDKLSFDHPPIHTQIDWEQMLNKTFMDVEKLASLIEQLPENKLGETFTDEKYSDYYRNLHGIIEHTHYHLGQIVLIKKILLQKNQ